MADLSTRLRIETSINSSGKILNEGLIPILREKHYYVKDYELDGDAPKQFIKAYVYEDEESNIRVKNPKSWYSYIAKTAEKWYPHESVIEYMINRIGQEMGLGMNGVKLVKVNGQIRFLSRYFLNKNEKLIHGAEICGQHLGDTEMADEIAKSRSTARDLFTFEFIHEAIENVFPTCSGQILDSLVKMIAFDALVGNNDRHFYNWGVIDTKKKTRLAPAFAPIYDSARGLLWNQSDENIVKMYNLHLDGGKRVLKYIEEAYPRISIEGNSEASHFELIKYVKKYNKSYESIVNQLACVENETRIIKVVEKEFAPFFIRERFELIIFILKNRFKRVREI